MRYKYCRPAAHLAVSTERETKGDIQRSSKNAEDTDVCATGNYIALILIDFALFQVMEETNTYVTWPSRLKIGAKSKKGTKLSIA